MRMRVHVYGRLSSSSHLSIVTHNLPAGWGAWKSMYNFTVQGSVGLHGLLPASWGGMSGLSFMAVTNTSVTGTSQTAAHRAAVCSHQIA